jgi:hypothetical protein
VDAAGENRQHRWAVGPQQREEEVVVAGEHSSVQRINQHLGRDGQWPAAQHGRLGLHLL